MIVLNIMCDSEEAKCKFRDRLCEALVGSPAFINSEIAITDFAGLDKVLGVFIGTSNDSDIEFDLKADNFVVHSEPPKEEHNA